MNKLMLFAAVLLLNMLWLSKASANHCTVSAANVAFGSFSPLTGSTVDSTGTITVDCNKLALLYTIALSPGGSASYTPRSMANGSNYLYYNLYLDAGYSQIWGDGTGGSSTVSGLLVLTTSNDHTVYGRIPLASQRNAMVGNYSDSITVTVTYL